MKPLYLRMTSFGPYVSEEIDFTKLKDKELFLITGDTGSGKTTIFDAISVALFGETSGNEKTVTSLKSDHSKATELMKVELEFEIKDKSYFVSRVPKQLRPKQRGEGFTEEKGSVELFEIDSGVRKLIDTDKDVTTKIIQLIGLNAKQFRQIVMIPQNQFRKLLTESSEEREKILKSIFDIYKYQLFQRKLEEKATEMKDQIDEIKRIMDIELHHINIENDLELKQAINEKEKNYKEIIELVHVKVKADKDLLETKKVNLNIMAKELGEIEDKIIAIKKDNDILEQLRLAKEKQSLLADKRQSIDTLVIKVKRAGEAKQIENIEKNLNDWQETLKKYNSVMNEVGEEEKSAIKALEENNKEYQKLVTEEKIEKIKAQKEKLTRLKLLKPDVINYFKAKEDYTKIHKVFTDENTTIERLKVEIEEESEKLEEYGKRKELNQQNLLSLEKINSQLKELLRDKSLIELTIDEMNKAEALKKKITKANKLIKEKNESYEKAYNNHKIAYRNYIEGQAYLLAKDLQEGEPCPVCGNTHHIKEHEIKKDILNHEDIQQSQDQLEELKKNIDDLNNKHTVDKSGLKHLEDSIQVKYDELEIRCEEVGIIKKLDSGNLSSALEHVIKTSQQLGVKQKSVESEIKEFMQYERKLLKADEVLKEKKSKLEQFENNHKGTIEERGAIINEGKLLKAKIPEEYNTIDKIDSDSEKLKVIIEKHEKHLVHVQNELNRINSQIAGLKARKFEINNNIENAGKRVEEAEKAFIESLKNHQFLDIEDYQKSKLSIDLITNYEKNITEFNNSYIINQNEINQLLEKSKDIKPVDIKEFVKQKDEVSEEISNITKEMERINLSVSNNMKQIDTIEKYLEKFNHSLMEHSVIDELTKVTTGARGTKRITFERYILSAFLKDIIDAANVRLYKMTNSRYQLYLKNQVEDKRKQSGLDFDVYDYYTNKSRDVNTLSGGEGFKASLSLALGVGDVARAYAGGISIDMIFIDEGFGTLSSEYLDNAINCLLDLNDKGTLVGIISHVAELKERIDTQLIVEKSKLGSKIKLKV